MSDAERHYCANVAPRAELDAAARVLNIQPDADREWENLDPSDPAYVQICKRAYQAQGDAAMPPPGNVRPGNVNAPTPPFGPGASSTALPPNP